MDKRLLKGKEVYCLYFKRTAAFREKGSTGRVKMLIKITVMQCMEILHRFAYSRPSVSEQPRRAN